MTLAIAAHGPQAGAAVYQAVLAAELLGRGEIGGFVVLAVLDASGQVQHACVQQGGITALDIPPHWLTAPHAAVITSGPDRPEPLLQFLPAGTGLGLVTGHRLPNRPDQGTGQPLNRCVLTRMAAGQHPQAAIDALLQANPQADAGLIALSPQGQIGFANSARVAQRPDAGQAHWYSADAGFALLHNSIYAAEALAPCLGNLLRTSLAPTAEAAASHRLVRLVGAVPVDIGPADAVHINAQAEVQRVVSADPFMAQAAQSITLLPLATPVLHNGQLAGHMATELFATVTQQVARPAPHALANLALMLCASA